jgi:hypothetical protein
MIRLENVVGRHLLRRRLHGSKVIAHPRKTGKRWGGRAVTGKRVEAQKVLDKMNDISKQKHVSAVFMAKIYAGLQDNEKTFEWLEKAYEDRSIVSVGFVKTNPMFDPLRSDPRFIDLLRRTNLQP